MLAVENVSGILHSNERKLKLCSAALWKVKRETAVSSCYNGSLHTWYFYRNTRYAFTVLIIHFSTHSQLIKSGDFRRGFRICVFLLLGEYGDKLPFNTICKRQITDDSVERLVDVF